MKVKCDRERGGRRRRKRSEDAKPGRSGRERGRWREREEERMEGEREGKIHLDYSNFATSKSLVLTVNDTAVLIPPIGMP